MKKYIRRIILSALIAALIVAAFIFLPSGCALLNISVNEHEVSVFVGSSSLAAPPGGPYQTGRENLLAKLSRNNPEDVFSAVMVLDDYYSVEEIIQFAGNEKLAITNVYFWTPGKTGRASAAVTDNDIKGAIQGIIESMRTIGGAEQDYERLKNGEFGIFCIVAEAPASRLCKLADADMIEFADIKYSEAAERIAKDRGVTVQYIEFPYKPDGAL